MQAEVERLCRYLKNDSVVRWKTGCSQADVDAARARIAAKREYGNDYLPAHMVGHDPTIEETRRAQRALKGNRAYLAALVRVHG